MSYKNLSDKKYYSRYSSGLLSKRTDFTMRSVISPVFESLTLGELGIPKIKISYWTPKNTYHCIPLYEKISKLHYFAQEDLKLNYQMKFG